MASTAMDQNRQSADERLRKLTATVPAMIYQFVMRPDGTFYLPFVSEWAVEYLGLDRAALAESAESIIAMVHPADYAAYEASVMRSAETMEPLYWEGRFTLKNGTVAYMRSNSTPERWPDGSVAWSGILTDITEGRQVREDLRLQTRAIETVPDSITIADVRQPDMPLVYVNPSFERVTGYSAAEVLGKNCRFLQGKDTSQPGLTTLREALREGRGCVVELRNYRKDGTLFWNELQLSPVHDEQGNLTHYLGVQSDITARKQTELKLSKQATELATVVEVSAVAARIQDPQEMLQTVVDLTKRNFNLYHAHIYLLNSAGNMLVLTAGADEVGRQMVADGRMIPLSATKSLIATAARTRQGAIRNYRQADEGYLPQTLLANTRSELAVPIMIGDELLGVLDVRSDIYEYFGEDDIRIQTTLASQVAIALQNARSFERSQEALHELNMLTQRLTREGWQDYRKGAKTAALAYAYDEQGLRPSPPETPHTAVDITQPLTVHGVTVGEVALAEPAVLEEDAAEIVHAVAERLSAHLDNLRLSEQTSKALAETEGLYKASDRIVRASSAQEALVALVETSALQAMDRAVLIMFDRPWTVTPPAWAVNVAVWQQKGIDGGDPTGIRYATADLPLVRHFQRDRAVLFRDIEHDPRVQGGVRAMLGEQGMRSLLVVPLVANNQWLGVLMVQASEPASLTDEDVRQVSTLADQAATVIVNQQLLAQSQARAEQERRINEITNRIRRGGDRDAILRIAREEIARLLGMGKSTVRLGTEDQLRAHLPQKEQTERGQNGRNGSQ